MDYKKKPSKDHFNQGWRTGSIYAKIPYLSLILPLREGGVEGKKVRLWSMKSDEEELLIES